MRVSQLMHAVALSNERDAVHSELVSCRVTIVLRVMSRLGFLV